MNSVKNIKYEILQLSKSFLAFTLAVVLASGSVAGCALGGDSDDLSDEQKKKEGVRKKVLNNIDDFSQYFPKDFTEKNVTAENAQSIIDYKNESNAAEYRVYGESEAGAEGSGRTKIKETLRKGGLRESPPPAVDVNFGKEPIEEWEGKAEKAKSDVGNLSGEVDKFLNDPIQANNINKIKELSIEGDKDVKENLLSKVAVGLGLAAENATPKVKIWFGKTSSQLLVMIAKAVSKNKNIGSSLMDIIKNSEESKLNSIKEINVSVVINKLYKKTIDKMGNMEVAKKVMIVLFGDGKNKGGILANKSADTEVEDVSGAKIMKMINDINISEADKEFVKHLERIKDFLKIALSILADSSLFEMIGCEKGVAEKAKKVLLEANVGLEAKGEDCKITANQLKVAEKYFGSKTDSVKAAKVKEKDIDENMSISKIHYLLRLYNVLQSGKDLLEEKKSEK